MCLVNNERERNILGEEEYQIGREPIWWRRRRKEKRERKERGKKEKEKENERKNKKEGECVRVRGKKNDGRRKKKKGNDTSLRYLRRTNSQNASRQEIKLVHAMRATCGYQNLRVLWRSKR